MAVPALTGCGGGGNGTGGGAPSAPSPQISGISPSSGIIGSSAISIGVGGANFQSTSVVQWNGTPLVTTYTSAVRLDAAVPATLLTAVGTAQLTVSNAGVLSNSVVFTTNNPVPALTSISPGSATAGSGAVTLTVSGSATMTGSTGTGFSSGSVVMWNSTALATTFVDASTLKATVPAALLGSATSAQVSVATSAPGGGTSASKVFYVVSNATTTGFVDAIPASMAWDSMHGLIYASVPNLAYGQGVYAGNLIAINPLTATVVAQQVAGNSPDQIGLSPDQTFLWLSHDETGAIQRYGLPGLSPGATIVNPSSPKSNPVESLQVAPDNASTMAVVYEGFYPPGLVIYDGTTPRAKTASTYSQIDWVQWGAASNVLYGSTTQTFPDSNWVYTVDATGVSSSLGVGVNFIPFQGEIHYDAASKLLYHDDGQVFDPSSNALVGRFDLSHFLTDTLCVVDSKQGVVFFLGQLIEPSNAGLNFAIEAFDQNSHALLRTMVIPNSGSSQGMISNFLRWGNAGLAFGVLHPGYQTVGKIGGTFFVDGAFVNPTAAADTAYATPVQALPTLSAISPQSATAGSGNVTLTVSGSGFEGVSKIYWGTQALQTTVVNSTTMQATIPAADLSSASSTAISVSDGDTSTLDSGTLIFSVVPPGSSLSAFNLAALGLAWDSNTNLLYAGVQGSDPMYPDTVVGLNPNTGQVTRSQHVVDDPWLVRTTSDGSHLYAASMDTSMVAQIPLPAFGPPSSWTLGHAPYGGDGGSYSAQALETAPGSSDTYAVSFAVSDIANPGGAPSYGGIAVYDSATQRPSVASWTLFDLNKSYEFLSWGATNASLYATPRMYSNPGVLYQLGVNSSGVTQTNAIPLSYNNEAAMHFDSKSGHIFDDDGNVVDPATGKLIGSLGSSGIVAIDSTLNRAYVLGKQASSNNYAIAIYDMTTLVQVGTIALPTVIGTPYAMVRSGSSGLAFSTYNSSDSLGNLPVGMLYVVGNPAVLSSKISEQPFGQAMEGVKRTWPGMSAPNRTRTAQRKVVMHPRQLRALLSSK